MRRFQISRRTNRSFCKKGRAALTGGKFESALVSLACQRKITLVRSRHKRAQEDVPGLWRTDAAGLFMQGHCKYACEDAYKVHGIGARLAPLSAIRPAGTNPHHGRPLHMPPRPRSDKQAQTKAFHPYICRHQNPAPAARIFSQILNRALHGTAAPLSSFALAFKSGPYIDLFSHKMI